MKILKFIFLINLFLTSCFKPKEDDNTVNVKKDDLKRLIIRYVISSARAGDSLDVIFATTAPFNKIDIIKIANSIELTPKPGENYSYIESMKSDFFKKGEGFDYFIKNFNALNTFKKIKNNGEKIYSILSKKIKLCF